MSGLKKYPYIRNKEFGRITGTGMNSDDYDEDNEVTVRGAIKNTVVLHHGAIAYDVAQRGTHGIMLPDNMTKEQLDEYINKNAGEVKLIDLRDIPTDSSAKLPDEFSVHVNTEHYKTIKCATEDLNKNKGVK